MEHGPRERNSARPGVERGRSKGLGRQRQELDGEREGALGSGGGAGTASAKALRQAHLPAWGAERAPCAWSHQALACRGQVFFSGQGEGLRVPGRTVTRSDSQGKNSSGSAPFGSGCGGGPETVYSCGRYDSGSEGAGLMCMLWSEPGGSRADAYGGVQSSWGLSAWVGHR